MRYVLIALAGVGALALARLAVRLMAALIERTVLASDPEPADPDHEAAVAYAKRSEIAALRELSPSELEAAHRSAPDAATRETIGHEAWRRSLIGAGSDSLAAWQAYEEGGREELTDFIKALDAQRLAGLEYVCRETWAIHERDTTVAGRWANVLLATLEDEKALRDAAANVAEGVR